MTRPTWRETLAAPPLGDTPACREGIAAVVGDLDAPMPCSWAWALAVFSAPGLPTQWYVGWGVGRLATPADCGIVPGANLAGANLCAADLTGANLFDAGLRFADLTGANLCGANLAGANLCDANLRSANLCDANLCDANLRDANLRSANLRDADLTGARRDADDPAIPGWAVIDGRLAGDNP